MRRPLSRGLSLLACNGVVTVDVRRIEVIQESRDGKTGPG